MLDFYKTQRLVASPKYIDRLISSYASKPMRLYYRLEGSYGSAPDELLQGSRLPPDDPPVSDRIQSSCIGVAIEACRIYKATFLCLQNSIHNYGLA